MNRKEAVDLLPIIKAFSEGISIQYRIKDNKSAKWNDVDKNYHEFSPHSFIYRIKPESKYRPFANAEECWQEMQKHQPFGWVKGKREIEDTYFIITGLTNDTSGVTLNISKGWSFYGLFSYYIFADGTPFGILKEE